MKFKRWSWFLAALLLVTFAVSVFAEDNYVVDAKKWKKKGPYTVALCNISVVNSWRVAMVEEFKYEASKHKDIKQVVVTDAANNVAKQIADMEDLITKKVDLIVITAPPTALVPAVEKAVDAGIPVVSFDSVVDSPKVTVKNIADQSEIGEQLAQYIATQLKGKGKVAMLTGIAGTTPGQMRYEGALKVFKKYPGIKVVGQVWTNSAYDQAKRAAENFISANPDLKAIYADGGPSGYGAMQATYEAKRPDIIVVGTGSNGHFNLWKKWRDSGAKVRSFAIQDPPGDSAVALALGMKLLRGQKVQHIEKMKLWTCTDKTLDKVARPDLGDDYINSTFLPEEMKVKLWGKK
ncbi:monosaccharide ABC transporter substrate-binding protein (CUT2 family) [Hydrogenispora ethanolica]|jgi:ribose transport system substrate-binding protein|uniref:Monosaccharide ABC transporter substrate-binding protein (CUT2 family) n=1 Tax=Hydrogenispora ethanolica TaxID=1082276 RepID=A0A4R1RST1_HYDET|nr:substrate-binding domain-containing protein [Hydrogenispora ethanolica]TCL69389.1 monosaccharide ABC transporter substrate-binding protein (CUT2 family) [Hydrogenispora ethanolica]